MKTYLVLDCNYLSWRAYHTKGQLSWKGKSTGVIYGVLQDIVSLQDLHGTKRMVFCFDYSRKHLLRRVDYPGYKSRRDLKKTPVEEAMYRDVQRQMRMLREGILYDLGYRNIFTEKGYEADDLIASVVNSLGKKEEAIIVGADQDLYQLLGPRVLLYNPTQGKAVTEDSFSKQYGISPIQWVDVKAIAGCRGDDVVGVQGVGELTACKFLNGTLQAGSYKHNLIVKGNKVWRRNRAIVKLPYPGTPKCVLEKDKVTDEKWQAVCERFGIRSLHKGMGYGKEDQTKAKGKRGRKGFFV